MIFRRTLFALVAVCVIPILWHHFALRDRELDLVVDQTPTTEAVAEASEAIHARPPLPGASGIGSPPDDGPLSSVDHTDGISSDIANRLANRFYVLPYELEKSRATMNETVSGHVKRYSAKAGAEYGDIFSRLALDERGRNQLSNHITSIERARAEAEAYLIQLGMAKQAYDKNARELLTPAQYQAFREEEAALPAKREFKVLTEFLGGQVGGNGLDPEHEGVLLEALKQSKRTPELDGPYGRGTRAVVGREQVLDMLMEDITRIRSEYAALLEALPLSADWTVPRENISQYYGTQILTKQRAIDFMSSDKPPVPPPQPGP